MAVSVACRRLLKVPTAYPRNPGDVLEVFFPKDTLTYLVSEHNGLQTM